MLKELLIEKLCLNGELVIINSRTGEYLQQIQYKGEGYQHGELCGGGGIRFYAQDTEIFYYQTWVS